MHGIIVNQLQKYVISNFGEEAWRNLQEASLGYIQDFKLTESYSDENVVEIIKEAVKQTNVPIAELLEGFGEFVGGNLVAMYWHMINPEWKTMDFLEHVEDSIHVNIRKTVPNAHPPYLKCIRKSKREVTILYTSPRRMCHVAKGMIKGVAAHYDEKIIIEEKHCMYDNHPWCEISIELYEKDFTVSAKKSPLEKKKSSLKTKDKTYAPSDLFFTQENFSTESLDKNSSNKTSSSVKISEENLPVKNLLSLSDVKEEKILTVAKNIFEEVPNKVSDEKLIVKGFSSLKTINEDWSDGDFTSMNTSNFDTKNVMNKNDLNNINIPGFEIVSELGRGGMGVVYKGIQKSLGRHVAIKIIHPECINRSLRERFKLEARTMASINHPNVVNIIDFGNYKDDYCIVMEYVEGEPLQDIVDRNALSEEYSLEILKSIARALVCFEKNNIIHRDIKPANIIIDIYEIPKLFDFGLAKSMSENIALTQTGACTGTPFYMPPEQMEGKKITDIRTDIYALGATLYCCLTGKPRFSSCNSFAEIYHKTLTTTNIEKGLFSEKVEMVLDRMLQIQVENRCTPQELIEIMRV